MTLRVAGAAMIAIIALAVGLLLPSPPPAPVPCTDFSGALSSARRAIQQFESIELSTKATPWELFYGLLGHGSDFSIADEERRVSCQRWLLEHATFRPVLHGSSIATIMNGEPAFLGDMEPGRPAGLEGHFCQSLFILGRVNPDARNVPVTLPPDGASAKLSRFIDGAQRLTSVASDLSWALPLFARFGRQEWSNRFGERWDLDRLADEQLKQRGTSTACFGCHWRMAIACCVAESPKAFGSDIRRRQRAMLNELVDEAKARCGSDGRFAFDVEPPGGAPWQAVVSYQAHTIEWLTIALSRSELVSQPWLSRACSRLVADLDEHPDVPYGTRCHAAAALRTFVARASE